SRLKGKHWRSDEAERTGQRIQFSDTQHGSWPAVRLQLDHHRFAGLERTHLMPAFTRGLGEGGGILPDRRPGVVVHGNGQLGFEEVERVEGVLRSEEHTSELQS